MDIKTFLYTELPLGKANEHKVFCSDSHVEVEIVNAPKLSLSVIVARDEQGYRFTYDSLDNTQGHYYGSSAWPSLYDAPHSSKDYIYTFLDMICEKRPVFAKHIKAAVDASRQRSLFG